MDLTTRQEGAAVVLAVGGELDLDTVAPLTEALGRAARDGAGQVVVLDLSGVTFADSTTVNVLLRAREDLGDRLRIARPSAFLQRLFDVIGLEAALSVHGTVASALAGGASTDATAHVATSHDTTSHDGTGRGAVGSAVPGVGE
ncbi:STAS domain-containing protein [Streptomyces bomunensis]|uniref:Anti-sigma factor antagonist n=2 Tax=Streptomyces montanisoli TaxID=2798581 RepID=A0A940MCA4_9ACTN|nr:STAS domain-containing protein [Streptomyces montanisoli]